MLGGLVGASVGAVEAVGPVEARFRGLDRTAKGIRLCRGARSQGEVDKRKKGAEDTVGCARREGSEFLNYLSPEKLP